MKTLINLNYKPHLSFFQLTTFFQLKTVSLVFLVIISLSLTACNTGGISGTGGGSAQYAYRFLPSKLIVDLPDNLVINQKNPDRKTSPLKIFQEISLVNVRQKNLQNQLDIIFIDAAFEQIMEACEDTKTNETCYILPGQIYFTFTRAMANTQRELVLAKWQAENRSQQVINEGLVDLDRYHNGIVEDQIPLDETQFTKLDGIPYDYNVKQLRGSIFSVLSERVSWSLSWTADKKKAQVYSEATIPGEGHGIFYSFYQDRADGSSMTTRNTTELESGNTSVTKLTIKERLDGQQGVYLRASSFDTYTSSIPLLYNLEGVDNDLGGYAVTHFEQPTKGDGFKTRETINTIGAPIDYEICTYQTDSSRCNDDINWQSGIANEPDEDIKESNFFTIYNAIENFSAAIHQAGISIQNLPETSQSFVIASQGFPEKREALMCSGQRRTGVNDNNILLHCGVDTDTLLKMELSVYDEVISDGVISYQLLDSVISINN